jgi:hypothetical protein
MQECSLKSSSHAVIVFEASKSSSIGIRIENERFRGVMLIGWINPYSLSSKDS